MISNIIAFIPFGVMLGACFKRVTFWHKLAVILAFSVGVEITQFVLAIGVSDITDVMMNTLGGFMGLALYDGAGKLVGDTCLDRFIFVIGTVILMVLLYLRIFVFRVQY